MDGGRWTIERSELVTGTCGGYADILKRSRTLIKNPAHQMSSPTQVYATGLTIWANEHGHDAAARGGTCGTGGVDRDVARKHHGVAAVPLLGLDPCQRVEQGGYEARGGDVRACSSARRRARSRGRNAECE